MSDVYYVLLELEEVCALSVSFYTLVIRITRSVALQSSVSCLLQHTDNYNEHLTNDKVQQHVATHFVLHYPNLFCLLTTIQKDKSTSCILLSVALGLLYVGSTKMRSCTVSHLISHQVVTLKYSDFIAGMCCLEHHSFTGPTDSFTGLTWLQVSTIGYSSNKSSPTGLAQNSTQCYQNLYRIVCGCDG